ncbi:hypothetical protein MHB48_03650 [Psychrobacillus sp. FSL H8-0483]|uniref:hypothetical protein n=1 Tax=Psychrobacillus sp. FSL H8-0483 TaxID=2921389 RepID=UPI00315AA018
MGGIFANFYRENNTKLTFILLPLLIVFVAISVYSLSRPVTTTNQINGNTSQIETVYDYKATITPNVLYQVESIRNRSRSANKGAESDPAYALD